MLIVLACLFTGCKGEVAGGQENEQENPYAKITVINNRHDNGDNICVIDGFLFDFTNGRRHSTQYVPITVNPGETKVWILPDINLSEGYEPYSVDVNCTNIDRSEFERLDSIDTSVLYFLDNDGNYKFKKTKKTITWGFNGFIVTEEDL